MERFLKCCLFALPFAIATRGLAKPKITVQLAAESFDSSGLFEKIFIVLPDGSHATAECWTGVQRSCVIDSFAPEKRIKKDCFSQREHIQATCYVGQAYYASRKVNDITIYSPNGERVYHIIGSWSSFEEGYLPPIWSTPSNPQKAAPLQEFDALEKQALTGDPDAEFKVGYAYFSGQGVQQDYAKATNWFRKSADQGNAQAQDNLGIIYENGYGTAKDYAQAAVWYRRAAEQGNGDAQTVLAAMYANGDGLPQDYGQAVTWFRKAAEEGRAEAQYNLGLLYDNGKGVTKDEGQAAFWYRKAAEQGQPDAQLYLGAMYGSGQGVPQDWVESYFWLDLAAGSQPKAAKLEDVAKYRDAAGSHLTKTVLLQTQERTRKWLDSHPSLMKAN
jgi:TPR repeat protein